MNERLKEIVLNIKYIMEREKEQGQLSKPFENFLDTSLKELCEIPEYCELEEIR